MRLGKHDSDSWTIGTGSLQGCFFSPFFFSLHTVKILKFVDDTTLIELISGRDETAYKGEIDYQSLN